MTLSLESLGITKEELQERVINKICENVLSSVGYDEDGNEEQSASRFHRKVTDEVKKHIDRTIEAMAAKHVLPKITDFIEGLCLEKTNEWGEKTGNKFTFIEYLVSRAENYIREKVDFNGRSKEECIARRDSYAGDSQTRIAHMVGGHLQYSIERAMKSSLETCNNAIAGGIELAVKIKLEEIKDKIKATVQIK